MQAAASHTVRPVWIKGQAGHPQNEKCDKLAVAAAKAPEEELAEDEGFTKEETNLSKLL